jgi:hypothetical protein
MNVVIPGPEPTGPAFGRPDDRLSDAARQEPRLLGCRYGRGGRGLWIPWSGGRACNRRFVLGGDITQCSKTFPLLDHFVGELLKAQRDIEAERLGSL